MSEAADRGKATEVSRISILGNLLGGSPGFSTTQGQILSSLLAESGYHVRTASSRVNRPLRLLEIFWCLIRNFRTTDLVILEVYSGQYFIVADLVTFLCKLLKVPCVGVTHGGSLGDFQKKFPKWCKRVLARAVKLVSPSGFLVEELAPLGFEVEIIPNVVDVSQLAFRKRSKIEPKLIWMRAFHDVYHPEMAVHVLEKLQKRFPAASLVMAGSDKGKEEELRELVKVRGLTDSVKFVGFLDNRGKLEEFDKADIFLNTNRVDNMPVSVIEARALGLPVVATNVGGLGHMIEDGEDGFLTPNEDVDAMVSRVEQLLSDHELVERISINGRRKAELSAWPAVHLQWKQVFRSVFGVVRSADRVLLTR